MTPATVAARSARDEMDSVLTAAQMGAMSIVQLQALKYLDIRHVPYITADQLNFAPSTTQLTAFFKKLNDKNLLPGLSKSTLAGLSSDARLALPDVLANQGNSPYVDPKATYQGAPLWEIAAMAPGTVSTRSNADTMDKYLTADQIGVMSTQQISALQHPETMDLAAV
jgi:hypothetical protein